MNAALNDDASILPCQFLDRRLNFSGEQLLMLAILRSAYDDFQIPRYQYDVEEWINGGRRNVAVPFSLCCNVLGIEPARARSTFLMACWSGAYLPQILHRQGL